MKKLITNLSYFFLLSVSIFYSNQVNAQSPLAGVYTVGSNASDDFSSISQCVDSLELRGVSASVIIRIDTGTFSEQINIQSISGSSATKNVIFVGKGNSTVVQYTPSSTNQAVISVNGASHLVFDSLKVEASGNYGIGINLYGEADSITIQNCTIELPNTSSTNNCTGIANYSSNDGTGVSQAKDLIIYNDSIKGGYIGIRLTGDLTTINNFNIEENTILNFGFLGMHTNSTRNMIIRDNKVFSSISGARSAISMWPTGANVTIINNLLELGSVVNHTRVLQVAGAPGSGGSSWSEQILVANNMVRYHGTQTSNVTGIYTKHVNYLKIYNNTVHMASGGGVKSLWLDALSSTSNIEVKNNNLSNSITNGELLRVHGQVTTTADYNNHYNPNGFRVWWKGSVYASLSAYQTGSSQGANSVTVNPDFVSSTDLHIDSSNATFDGLGTYVSEVQTDFDGESRNSSNPDIGADEFNSHTDVSIGNLTSPTNCRKVSSAQTISVWIKNHGPYSISNVPIVYQLNNNSPIDEVHSSSIPSNDSALHTFSTLGNFSASGTYNLKFYTNHPVDENTANDTAEYSIAFTGLFTNMLDSIGICLGEDLTLDPAGSAASSYLWSDGSTSSTLELDGTSLTVGKTMYGVMLTDASGCILTDSIQVIVSNPAIVNLGADTILCAENSIVLGTTISNGSYKWNDNSTNKTLNVSSYGTYSVAVTSGFNCTISDTIAVNFFSPITLNMSTEEEFCIGDSVELTPGIYASYLWNDLSTQSSLSIYNTGVYSVTVLDSFGCIGKDTTVVTVNELPDFTLGNDTSMCEGGSLVLNAWVLGHIYKWQDNSTNSQFNVTDAGTYWVTLTSGKTCSATDSINVWVDAKPEVDLGLDTAICEGSSLNLNVFVQGASYVWQDNSTNASLDVTSAGDYSVELTSEDGCVNSDSITVSTNPNPIIDLGKDTLIGYGRIKDNALRLEVASGYESYLWSTGATENYIVIDESINLGKHEYSVIVTNSFGCSSYDTIQVEVFDNSSVNGLGYSKLVVYPNPSSDKISIYLEGLNGNIRLKLSDMFGRMIMSEELYIANNSISKSMDLSALPKGSYLLFLQGENGAKTVKIILN